MDLYLKSSLPALGMIPSSIPPSIPLSGEVPDGVYSGPSIVYVFPLPVWPYAIMQTLYLKEGRGLQGCNINIPTSTSFKNRQIKVKIWQLRAKM